MASASTNKTITRLAQQEDAKHVLDLSRCVQDALLAAGSAQEMRPVTLDRIEQTIKEERCFAMDLETREDGPIGCAFVKQIDSDYYASIPGFTQSNYPGPYLTLHSIMLNPEYQGKGRGFGLQLVTGALRLIRERHQTGTIFLDCWATNEKLLEFYRKASWNFAAVVPEGTWEVAVFVQSLDE